MSTVVNRLFMVARHEGGLVSESFDEMHIGHLILCRIMSIQMVNKPTSKKCFIF